MRERGQLIGMDEAMTADIRVAMDTNTDLSIATMQPIDSFFNKKQVAKKVSEMRANENVPAPTLIRNKYMTQDYWTGIMEQVESVEDSDDGEDLEVQVKEQEDLLYLQEHIDKRK